MRTHTGGNHDVLLAVDLVGDRTTPAAGTGTEFPQFLPSLVIVGIQETPRIASNHKTACCCQYGAEGRKVVANVPLNLARIRITSSKISVSLMAGRIDQGTLRQAQSKSVNRHVCEILLGGRNGIAHLHSGHVPELGFRIIGTL